MQRLLKLAGAVWAAALVTVIHAQTPASLDTLFEDEVVARGKGVLVKRTQLESAFIAYVSNLAGRGQSVPETERLERERILLDRLIVTQLLTNRAIEADRVKARNLTSNLVAQAQKEFPSEEAFRRRLMVLGVTPERYTNQVMEQALAQTVVDRELRSKITVGSAEIEDFYRTGNDGVARALQSELERLAKDPKTTADDLAELKKRIDALRKANLARLEQPERVRVSHVMLATYDPKTEAPLSDEQKKIKRTQIDKIRTAALAGEDFQKLIDQFSEDRQIKQTKGEYVLARESPFIPEFKVAAFSLDPGRVSDVITTAFGYHILKVAEKMPAQKADFDKVKPDIQTLLTEQEVQKRMPEYLRDLKKDTTVEVLDPKLRLEPGQETNPLKD
jgi:parvulin-like peptidyl-prolyl isomerase